MTRSLDADEQTVLAILDRCGHVHASPTEFRGKKAAFGFLPDLTLIRAEVDRMTFRHLYDRGVLRWDVLTHAYYRGE